jgi:poly [ADP-ribose] polymerase
MADQKKKGEEEKVMGQVVKLIMVTGSNNNKFYDMTEENGEFVATWGRVGVTSSTKRYPMHKWNGILKSKLRKGYKDVTSLRVEEESIDFQAIGDDAINQIVAELQTLANKSVQTNYTVSSNAVTQKQVEEAQKLLDLLAGTTWSKKAVNTQSFNDNLLELYQVIPRRMYKVQDYMVHPNMLREDVDKLIAKEQAALDVMKGQVRVNTVKKTNKAEDKRTILDAMELEIALVNDEDIKLIKKELGEISNKFRRAFKIINRRTQKRFDDYVEKSRNKKCRLFWHGSRNENWWSILDTGLVLRPTNAVITGKMFGYGLYFADKARKSYGYTSCRGSYWARGSASKGFMSLYSVHLGNTLTKKNHEGWMYKLTEDNLRKHGDYDSLTALGGADLRNNEFIIYNQNQCTVKYLVEID